MQQFPHHRFLRGQHPVRAGMAVFLICSLFSLFISCKKDEEKPAPNDIWDIEKDGIPRFVEKNYIELNKIYRISKFRSSVGHDYSDAFEQCRSMKHYFEPKGDIEWTSIAIYAPVTGTLTQVEQEWTGTKIEIMSDDYPAFRFSIFHVWPNNVMNVGDKVLAGQELGHHIGSQTYSDISVIVNDPSRQGRMVSYFYVITDALFAEFTARGISERDELIISKEMRDEHPLNCSGDSFTGMDSLESWVVLSTK